MTQRVKYVIYCLWILLFHCLGFSHLSFLEIGGAHPFLSLIPVIFIAIHEGNFIGSIFGVVAGVLADVNSADGSGFHALIFLLTGFLCGYFCEYILQKNNLSAVLLSFFAPLFVAFLKWAMSGSGFYFPLFLDYYFKDVIYTFVLAILLYKVFRITTDNTLSKVKFSGIYRNGKKPWKPAPIKRGVRQQTKGN